MTRLTLLISLITQIACGTALTPTRTTVSGREVEVVEAGSGSATVVFEAGLGNDWTAWDQVASEVSGSARVFAYSRPGYGHSAAAETPRDAIHLVEELRALLLARGFAPPYLLVGHSFGGAYMELFAKKHPGEVIGLVLVEARHRDFGTACAEAGLSGCSIPASAVSSLPQPDRAEVEGFASASAQIREAGGFGPYPVRVLSGTAHGFVPEAEALWAALQQSLAAEAADGQRGVFAGAGHLLHRERPHDVAKVILGLLPPPRS